MTDPPINAWSAIPRYSVGATEAGPAPFHEVFTIEEFDGGNGAHPVDPVANSGMVAITYKVIFGDGASMGPVNQHSFPHTYANPGSYSAVVQQWVATNSGPSHELGAAALYHSITVVVAATSPDFSLALKLLSQNTQFL